LIILKLLNTWSRIGLGIFIGSFMKEEKDVWGRRCINNNEIFIRSS